MQSAWICKASSGLVSLPNLVKTVFFFRKCLLSLEKLNSIPEKKKELFISFISRNLDIFAISMLCRRNRWLIFTLDASWPRHGQSPCTLKKIAFASNSDIWRYSAPFFAFCVVKYSEIISYYTLKAFIRLWERTNLMRRFGCTQWYLASFSVTQIKQRYKSVSQ